MSGFFLSQPRLSQAQDSPANLVTVVDIEEMIINPVVHEIITKAIEQAKDNNSQCLIIRLDTPGGLLETTRKIVKAMMNSPVPVVTYIWPPGARASSAGVFITLASHVAAMAPSTHMGAAHPVILHKSWGGIDQTMQDKVTNDTRTWIESVAKTRGRNVEWAGQAVTESASVSDGEALSSNIVDLVVKDLAALLLQLEGRTIETTQGTVTLRTKGATVEFIGLSLRQKILDQLINPNIAYLLMLLGFFGLIYEITHPGFGFPGLAGIISLILAFYAFQVLPTNYAGLALIILGLGFFVIEAFTPTFGAFTLAGIIALIFGSTILFNQPHEFLKVSLKIIFPVAISLGLISTFLVSLAVKAQQRKVTSGAQGLIGQIAEARTNISRKGKVFIHGEIWNAQSKQKISKGDEVVVEEVSGLKLIVKKKT
ncbi:nodulation protein NfeD [Candidatus Omnitrophota bacterium]